MCREILGHNPTEAERTAILSQYAGNAPDHVCRKCHAITRIDPLRDPLKCGKCGSPEVEDVYDLAGKPCLKCDGRFSPGQPSMIS